MALTVHRNVTIADTETTSEAVDLSIHLLSGIIVPAEFDGTTLTFTASAEPDGTFLPCYDVGGAAVTITTAAGRHVLLEPQSFGGARFLRLVADAQVGDTVITLVLLEGAG